MIALRYPDCSRTQERKENKLLTDRDVSQARQSLHQFTDTLVNYEKRSTLSIAESPETYRFNFLESQHHPPLHSDVGNKGKKEMAGKIKSLYNL